METEHARNKAIDIARGVTIALVVLGHAGAPEWLNAAFRPFRMPLFFLLSGYLFSTSKYLHDFKSFMIAKIWRLIVPYSTACIIFYSIWLLTDNIGEKTGIPPIKVLLGLLYGNGQWLFVNVSLWFLVCLFCAELSLWALTRLTTTFSFTRKLSIFFAVGIVGFVISKFAFLPWGLDIALVAQPFMLLGQRFKQHKTLRFSKYLILSSAIVYTLCIFSNSPDMNSRMYGNLFLFYIRGISGSILALELSRILASIKATAVTLSLFGRKSLYLLIFHMLAFIGISMLEKIFHLGITHWSIRWMIGLLFSLLVAYVIARMPYLRPLFDGKGFSISLVSRKRTNGTRLMEQPGVAYVPIKKPLQ